MTIQGDGVFVDKNSKILKNQEVEFTYDPINNNCNYGVILRYTSPSEYIYVVHQDKCTALYKMGNLWTKWIDSGNRR